MGFEVWIAIVIAASALSGWAGYAFARKGAPKQSELDAMAAELDEARQQADSVQANVSEHFEQSAMLFGKLASDYREFLDHFSASAQNLGLSEARARELIEQGFQPLLTHEAVDERVVADASVAETAQSAATAEAEAEAAEAPEAEAAETTETAETAETAEETVAEAEDPAVAVSEVTVQMPDDTADQATEDARRTEARELMEALGAETAAADSEEADREDALAKAADEAADEARQTKSA